MKYLVYSHKIVVYLTFDEFDKNNDYRYYLDGQLITKGNITNYTFDNLKENHSYHIKVFSNENIIFDEDINTLKKKKDIIVNVSDNTGTNIVTKEVQAYLDKADKDSRIVFLKGTYLCGALFIHSDTEIYLEEGATIQGSTSAKDYLPKIWSRFEGFEVYAYASLLNIGHLDHNKEPDTKNILIHGQGSIYGGDRLLRFDMLDLEKEHPVINDRFRNRLINISNCSNVIIDGLHVGKSASWNIHPIYSDHIYIHHCDFKSGGLPNGDGIDPDSCHDMDIFANVFYVGDDCVAIKSGKNPEGDVVNIPTYNVSIFDCASLGSHGCAIGSEISGGVHHVDIFNCDFNGSIFGIHIKTTKKRGGFVRDIRAKSCQVSSIQIHCVDYNDDGEAAKTITEFNNFTFEDIAITGIAKKPEGKVYNCEHINVDGIEGVDAFKNIYFKDITLLNNGDKPCIKIQNATHCVQENIMEK